MIYINKKKYNMVYCPKCGEEVNADELSCPYCKEPILRPLNYTTKKKSGISKIIMIPVLVVFIVLPVMCFPLIESVIEQRTQEAKYNAIHEITSGNEVTIIAADYINANIVSEEWNENVLECIKMNTVEMGMFAGRLRKQYYVFKGIQPGKTEIEFIVLEFGYLVRKTYEAEVSDSLYITVCPTGKEILEEKP